MLIIFFSSDCTIDILLFVLYLSIYLYVIMKNMSLSTAPKSKTEARQTETSTKVRGRSSCHWRVGIFLLTGHTRRVFFDVIVKTKKYVDNVEINVKINYRLATSMKTSVSIEHLRKNLIADKVVIFFLNILIQIIFLLINVQLKVSSIEKVFTLFDLFS